MMPKSCSAINCTRRSVKGNGLSFFKFPLKNPKLLCQWVHAMRRAEWEPNQHSTICSAHFNSDCYQLRPGASHPMLRSDAVPSVFNFNVDMDRESLETLDDKYYKMPKMPVKGFGRKAKKAARLVLHEHGYSVNDGSSSKAKLLKPRQPNRKKLLPSDAHMDDTVSPVCVSEDSNIDSIFVAPDASMLSTLAPDENTNKSMQPPSHHRAEGSEILLQFVDLNTTNPLVEESEVLVQAANCTSSERLEKVLEALEQECPEDAMVVDNMHSTSMEAVEENLTIAKPRPVIRYTTKVVADGKELECSMKEFKLRRRVRALQQDIRRLNLKLKNVLEQMYELRKEKNASEAAVTMVQHTFGGLAQEIFRNQMRNGMVAKGAERYSQVIKEFALSVYGHSPPAYEYLSNIFRLPHLSCIKAYSSSIKIPEDVVLLDYYHNMETTEVEAYQLHIP